MKAFGLEISKAKTSVKAQTASVGFVGLQASSGKVTEEFISNLQWPNAGKVYQEMSNNDAVIGACLYLIEILIRKANWHVVIPGANKAPVEGQPTTDVSGMEEWRLFIEQCLEDMEQSWDSTLAEILTMLPYGFSFHEIVYKVRRGPLEKDKKFNSKYTDGKIGWRGFFGRSQGTLDEWVFDDATGEAIAFKQDISKTAVKGGQGSIEIPIEGNLLFRLKDTRGNPEGVSILRKAYRSWYFKKYIEELEGIGVERNLAGIPVIQPDEQTQLFNPDDDRMVKLLQWATDLVSNIRRDTTHGVVLPYGWELKLMGAEGSGAAGINTDTIIHRHESRMAITMLSDLVLLGGDRTGSFALADTKKSLLIRSLESIMTIICSIVNKQAIPRLLILNGVTDLTNMPVLVADAIEEPSLSDLALILRAVNIDVTKNSELFNFVMRIASAPELKPEDIEKLKNEVMNPNGGNQDNGGDSTSGGADRFQDQTDNQLK